MTEIYNLIVNTGVRTEYLLHRLSQLEDETAEDDIMSSRSSDAGTDSLALSNKAYLESRLLYSKDPTSGAYRILTAQGDAVMMGWEKDIMERTAELLCRGASAADEFAVLNIGFGLGLVDTALQNRLVLLNKTVKHVIVEPHRDVLEFMRQAGWYDKPGVEIFQGTWREYIARQPTLFDAIYTDTFSEHWSDLAGFFTQLPRLFKVPNEASDSRSTRPPTLMDRGEEVDVPALAGPVFSFFNGLGGTNGTFYDVYTAMAHMELERIGFEVYWESFPLDPFSIADQDEGSIKRRYWDLPVIRIPIAYFKGAQGDGS